MWTYIDLATAAYYEERCSVNARVAVAHRHTAPPDAVHGCRSPATRPGYGLRPWWRLFGHPTSAARSPV